MPETQSQSKCPHCGYPIEIGEHALGCPDRSETEIEIGDQESLPDPEFSIIAEREQEFESDRFERVSRSRLERMKSGVRYLAEIGLISLAAFAPLKDAFGLQRAPKGESRQPNVTAPVEPGVQESWEQSEQFVENFEKMLAELEAAREDLDYLESVYAEPEFQYVLSRFKEQFKIQTMHPEISDTEVVTGFEGTPFESEKTAELLRTTYPKQWVSGEIDSIIYRPQASDDERTMGTQYNLGEGWIAGGRARGKQTGVTSIDLYVQQNMYELLEVYSHEIAHPNDWERDSQLSIPERAALLSQVTKRFISGDNLYPSHYVESINNEDPSSQLYTQVTEYWAEVCRAYFSNPNGLRADHPDDFALVDGWIKKQDPDFNPVTAAQQRTKLIVGVNQERMVAERDALSPEAQKDITLLQQQEVEHIFQEWQTGGQWVISQDFYDQLDTIVSEEGRDIRNIRVPVVSEIYEALATKRERALAEYASSLGTEDRERFEQEIPEDQELEYLEHIRTL